MALTRDFSGTVGARTARDPAFAKALLDEVVILFLNGDPRAARSVFRDLIDASIGFEALAVETKMASRSLHHMLSDCGNPNMDDLAVIFGALREYLGADSRQL
jgi:DNA-binding phage protein